MSDNPSPERNCEVRSGEPVDIDWFEASGVHRSARSVIHAVTANGLALRAPWLDGEAHRIEPGTEVTLAVREPVPLAAVARVTGAYRDGETLLLVTTKPLWTKASRERRALARVPVDLLVRVPGVSARVVDLNAGGCRMLWDGPPPPVHDRVSFLLRLPDGAAPLALTARVAYVRDDSGQIVVGLEFQDTARSVQDILASFALQCELPAT